MTLDAIILGAGAAGLMAAFTAGQRGRRVLVLDRADRPGKKILISGGGRCNFTNVGAGLTDRYHGANPRFARSALERYTPADFLALVEAHGIAWHEKTLGQLFCDGSARQIVAMLLDECDRGQVEIRCGQRITGLEHDGTAFRVETDAGRVIAPSLVLATGGPSIPKMGATGFAYDAARRFRMKVVEPRPALVPLTLGEADADLRALSGVAVQAEVRAGGAAFREATLFTHRGLSGPAVLQASSYWRHRQPLEIDLAAGVDIGATLIAAKRENPRQDVVNALSAQLPARLASALAARLSLTGPLSGQRDQRLAELGRVLSSWSFSPTGTEGFAKAEVTAGGIDTAALSQRTMEARAVPGLFAIGEAVDVTGWLGGYNFQWAWASGRACGEAL